MRRRKNQTNQQGFVSIVVTLILMIVLSLVVLGFARLSRREQRNTLDRHLSTQAFYAAESGINDFAKLIATTSQPISRQNCTDPWPAGIQNVLDATNNVSYTCVLYDTAPSSIRYDTITDNQVTIIPITNTDLTRIRVNWGTGSNFRPNDTTPPAALTAYGVPWDSDAGMLKVMLIPRAVKSRVSYMSGTFNGWLYPMDGAVNTSGTMVFGNGVGNSSSGVLANGSCNAGNTSALKCFMNIDTIPPAAEGWYMVVTSIYKSPESIIVTCENGGGVTPCKGAQIVLDATGKAQDVIRRVQVRKPFLDNASGFLPIGFQSVNSICKQIMIVPPLAVDLGKFLSPTCLAF